MKKSIEITAVDDEIANRAYALWLLNEFRALGFETRKAFVNVVMDYLPELNSFQGGCRLNNFWASREFGLSEELEKVLEHLKNS